MSSSEGETTGFSMARENDKRCGKIAAVSFAGVGTVCIIVGLVGWISSLGGGGGDVESEEPTETYRALPPPQDCRLAENLDTFEACVVGKRSHLKEAIQHLTEKQQARLEEFERFLLKFDREYYHKLDVEEFPRRLLIFSVTLDIIAERNNLENASDPNRAIHGITKYADWTPQEFRALLGYRPVENQSRRLFGVTGGSAPCTKNWATRSPTIRNQGGCGNCWTFSTVEGIRSAYMKQHGVDPGVLSTQFITDCMYKNKKCKGGVNGCCGGDVSSALEWIERQGGIPTQAAYGDVFSLAPERTTRRLQSGPVSHSGEGGTYSGNNPTTMYPCKSGIQKAVKVTGRPSQLRSESSMAQYVCSTGSITIAVDASSWQTYTGGVIRASSCGTSVDHAVLLIGITESQNAWIVQNSWGEDWGVSLGGVAVPTDEYSNCGQLAKSGDCNRRTSTGQKVKTVCAVSCSASPASLPSGGYIYLQYGANACGITTQPVTVPTLSSASGWNPSAPTPSTPSAPSGNTCNSNSGGTCSVFGCDQSRGPTICRAGECLCQTGYCAEGGMCVMTSCNPNSGGTCSVFSCSRSRGPTTCSRGECLCQEGYCAEGGRCVSGR